MSFFSFFPRFVWCPQIFFLTTYFYLNGLKRLYSNKPVVFLACSTYMLCKSDRKWYKCPWKKKILVVIHICVGAELTELPWHNRWIYDYLFPSVMIKVTSACLTTISVFDLSLFTSAQALWHRQKNMCANNNVIQVHMENIGRLLCLDKKLFK